MSTKKRPATTPETTPTSAYNRVEVSDGLTIGEQHQFDTTVQWSEDDQAKFEEYSGSITGQSRIRRMRDNLATLEPISDPYIAINAAEIRAIHARLSKFTEVLPPIDAEQWLAMSDEDRIRRQERAHLISHVTDVDARELDMADYLWRKIVTLRDIVPMAVKGDKFQGRQRGAVTVATEYILKMLDAHPGKKVPALADLVIKLAGEPDSPFDCDDVDDREILYEKGKESKEGFGRKQMIEKIRNAIRRRKSKKNSHQ
jgi:hypothetical protein